MIRRIHWPTAKRRAVLKNNTLLRLVFCWVTIKFLLKLQAIVAQKDDQTTSLKINIWSSVFAFCVQNQKYLHACDTVALLQMMRNLGTFAAVVYAKKFAPKNAAIATVSNTINVKMFDTGRLISSIGSMLEIAFRIIHNFVSCFGSTFLVPKVKYFKYAWSAFEN